MVSGVGWGLVSVLSLDYLDTKVPKNDGLHAKTTGLTVTILGSLEIQVVAGDLNQEVFVAPGPRLVLGGHMAEPAKHL